jgi:hypothetical protein
MRSFRIIILGAGFSYPAGLPLLADLTKEVRQEAIATLGKENPLEDELHDYIQFRSLADGISIHPEEINLEDILSFLDVEHYLALRGKDTWSRTGNEGQEVVKRIIGKVIHRHTPPASNVPDLYQRFASRLDCSDIIISFNYDILLERAMEAVGKPYRLFPQRYSEIHDTHAVIDDSKEEVVLLKLHGSVDWFDSSSYEETMHLIQSRDPRAPPIPNPVFAYPSQYEAVKIVDGPRHTDDPMTLMLRIRRVDDFYASEYPGETPWLLSPSASKFVYGSALKNLWYGLGEAGGWSLGLTIIGLSLSPQDEYLRRIVYSITRNYQESWWDQDFGGTKKTRMSIIDRRSNSAQSSELRERYRFVNWSRAQLELGGFQSSSLDTAFPTVH